MLRQKMNISMLRQKMNKGVAIVLLALALSFGTGLVSTQLGLADFGAPSAAYACGAGAGGGC